MVKVLTLLAVLALSGCVSAGSFCDVARPFRPSSVAALSDADVAAALTHNEKGAKLCGWKP